MNNLVHVFIVSLSVKYNNFYYEHNFSIDTYGWVADTQTRPFYWREQKKQVITELNFHLPCKCSLSSYKIEGFSLTFLFFFLPFSVV